jgi:hypothetical protein
MNIKSILKSSLVALGIIFLLVRCSTDDISPTLELSFSDSNLGEDNGIITLSATLNADAEQQILIPVSFSGTAEYLEDYSVSSEEIIIQSGSSSGNITFFGIQDEIIEGTETLIVELSNVQNVLLISESQIEISILDDDVDSDGDGVPDNVDNCPNELGQIANNGCPWLGFLINEVNYDPASDISGDSNGDGVRDANDDEFIEFFNSSEFDLDLTNFTVSDAAAVRHTFPNGTVIPSNGILVLFGGGNPAGDFGGAMVQTANGFQSRLNLNNAGDSVTIKDPNDEVVLSYNSSDTGVNHGSNQSVTRYPDLTGDFQLHSSISDANGSLFSPGTRVDGTSF